MLKVYRFIRFLSLDIVMGVAAGSAMACRFLDMRAPLSYKLLLPLAVWILYLSDHLLDGLRHRGKSPSSRYQVYYNNSRPLLILLAVLVTASLAILIFSFDSLTFHFGIVVGVIVFIYFIFQQMRFMGKINAFPKEPVIAVVYTLGIWGEPLYMFKGSFSPDLYAAVITFAIMVLMNVQLYSILQLNEDHESGYPSTAVAFGAGFTRNLNIIGGILVALISFSLIVWHPVKSMQSAGFFF